MSLLPHVHTPSHTTPVTRGVYGCVVLVSQESTTCCFCLASPINTGGRKSITHHPPSLHSERTIHIILYMYKKNLALDNIYSVPTHHSEHCGRCVQNFRWYVFNGCPTKRKRQNVYDRYPGHESRERKKRCPGLWGMSPPVDSSHKAALPSLPLESTYCDRET